MTAVADPPVPPATGRPPVEAGRERATASLPADVLLQSCKRVAIAATVFGSLFATALLVNNVLLRGQLSDVAA